MAFSRFFLAASVALALSLPAAASHHHHAPTSGHPAAHSGSRGGSASRSLRSGHKAPTAVEHGRGHARSHGQQSIDSERVMQIQQALIREHYLDGEASGRWDQTTIGAMQKFQNDQGWQTKLMPDSRALKKLGLGPDYSNAINANGSNFQAPAVSGTTTNEQSSNFAAAAGISR